MTISGGFGGVEPKKFSGSLSLAMTPLEHTSNFYPASLSLLRYSLSSSLPVFIFFMMFGTEQHSVGVIYLLV